MDTEVWFRNPDNYVKECVEVGALNVAWDRGFLRKRRTDPLKFLEIFYPVGLDFRTIVVGNNEQGADLYERGDTFGTPRQTVPVWEYGDDFPLLEELMATPPDTGEHRVVVSQTPLGSTGVGRKFYMTLRELQQEYPDAILHVHGLYSFRLAFGLGFRAADVEPRTGAQKGKVILPNGKEVAHERTAVVPQWVNLMGFRPSDLAVPRNRCMYNIKSAMWAGKHYRENIRFQHTGRVEVDPDDPFFKPPENKSIMVKRVQAQAGDKYLCDTCSLQLSCKYFRTGSVCSVPDSEPAELATYFKTRDSDTIIEGLGTVLAAQTRRAERGMAEEDIDGKLDPEVTKILKALVDQGIKLAKLVNPSLAAAGAARVTNLRLSQQTINATTPQGMMAAIVAELEAQGISRDSITKEMLTELFTAQDPVKARAIDVAAAEKSA